MEDIPLLDDRIRQKADSKYIPEYAGNEPATPFLLQEPVNHFTSLLVRDLASSDLVQVHIGEGEV